MTEDANPQDKAPQDKTPQDKAPQDKTPQDKAPQDKAPQDKTVDGKSADAEKLVRKYALGSVAAAVLPIPLLDAAIVGGVQFQLLRKLAALYEVDFVEQRANAIIGALAGVSMAMTAANVLARIPGIGLALGGLSSLTLPAASTYALGKVFIRHFESGGTFWTFDPEKVKKEHQAELAAGKGLVEQNYAGVKP